jgi:hypothetical protein
MHGLACGVAREGIRRQHPDANDSEVERFLCRRLELARQARNDYEPEMDRPTATGGQLNQVDARLGA